MTPFVRVILPLVIVLTILSTVRGREPDCCGAESRKLSQSQTTSLVQTTELIPVPCCGHGLRLKGTVSLRVVVDQWCPNPHKRHFNAPAHDWRRRRISEALEVPPSHHWRGKKGVLWSDHNRVRSHRLRCEIQIGLDPRNPR